LRWRVHQPDTVDQLRVVVASWDSGIATLPHHTGRLRQRRDITASERYLNALKSS
jgi:hypothetical protein